MAMFTDYETCKTKADEVEKLVIIASDCGIEKNIQLYDYLVNLVYRGSVRTKGSANGLQEFLNPTPDVKISDGDIQFIGDVKPVTADEIIDKMADALNGARISPLI